ncbi:MAG: E3 binding domain-containing protein, partial [Candidatus Eremiobacteraeota bacterium]|nr:E3 binding domain-containing protein [Candidatus Eremiobacteraeota bacterium]
MSDTIEVRIPNIGDFHDLPIIAVLVKAGDTVALESPLVELESEKATMEVPSPVAGVVRDVTVKLGDKVSEGATILTLVAANASPAASAPAPTPAEPVPPVHAASDATPVPGDAPPAPSSYGASGDAGAEQNGVVHASPSIRRFARELGVDLHAIVGTGPHARVTREDVQSHVKRALAAPAQATSGAGAAGA